MLTRIFLFICCCFFSVTTFATKAPATKPIIIGAIYNLTGLENMYDVESLRGAKLALSEINAAGGALGRQLQLEVIDGKSEQSAITKAAKRFANNKTNSGIVIGLNDTDMALAAIPPLEAKQKLFITTGATSPMLSSLGPESVMFACFVDSDQAAAAAEFAYDKLKVKNAIILEQNDMEYTRLLSGYFQQRFAQLGGTIIKLDTFSDSHINLKSNLKYIKSLKPTPEIFYLAAGANNVPKIIKQIRAAGFMQPILGGDSFDTNYVSDKLAKTFSQIYFTTHAYIAANNPAPKVQTFLTSYQKAYKVIPTSSFAALGYDTIKLIAKAIKDANAVDVAKVRAALLNIHDYDGITGTFNFSSNSPIPEKTVSIVQISNGKKSLVEELQPKKRF